MSAPKIQVEPLADAQATVLLKQVALSQAAHLARTGSYAAAEELLSGALATGQPDAGVLDLLARIRAQQGSMLDAESLWRKVQQLDPNHLGARAGLERLRKVHRPSAWFRPAVVAVIGLGVTWGLVTLLTRQENLPSDASAQLRQQLRPVLDQLAGMQAEAKRVAGRQEAIAEATDKQADTLRSAFGQELASVKDSFAQQMAALLADEKRLAAQQEADTLTIGNQLAALRLAVDRERALAAELEQRRVASELLQSDYRRVAASQEALLAQVALAQRPPNVTFAVPGVTTSVSGKVVIVTFDEGLFNSGTHLGSDAKERLLAVSKILSQQTEPLQIQVVGYADDDRFFLRWTAQWESALAFDRASTAAKYLLGLGLFAPDTLSIVAGNGQNRPFPSDSVGNRSKNRTVVLRITSPVPGKP